MYLRCEHIVVRLNLVDPIPDLYVYISEVSVNVCLLDLVIELCMEETASK